MGNRIVKIMLPLFYIFIIGCIGGFFYYNNINNKLRSPERLGIVDSNVDLKYGDTYKIEANPKDENEDNIKWESSDPNLVSVDDNGNISVHGNENKEVTITATTEDGKATASVKVDVSKVDKIINVTGIKLDKSTVTLKYGETSKITANISPVNATNKVINWTSSDNELVSVDNAGNIKAVGNKNGSATITATTASGNYKATAIVKVTYVDPSISVTGVKISKSSMTLKYGATGKISATISPSNATNKNVSWTSSNPSLVEVDANGNITTKKNEDGEATITVKTENGNYTDSIKVKVEAVNKVVDVTSLKLSTSAVTLKYGATTKISATIKPSNATNKGITWKSSDPSIVTVDEKGNIKAVANKDATVTVTATTASKGYKASVKVTVKKVNISATGVKLNSSVVQLAKGQTYNLVATVSPSDTTNKKVTWTSSDSSIVTVSDGVVTAKSLGVATITAKTSNGKSATVKIYVTSITINNGSAVIMDEATYKLSAKLINSIGTEKIVWQSSNSKVAVVNNGIITGKSVGTANIVAKITLSNNKVISSNQFKVTVRPRRILMVGNSKTYQSYLSRYVANMATKEGYSIEGVVYNNYKANALENFPDQDSSYKITYFRDTGGKTLKEISSIHSKELSQSYDYIILQEQTGNYSSTNYSDYYDGVLSILNTVYSKNKNIKMFIRKTWVLSDSSAKKREQGYNNTINVVNRLKKEKNYNVTIINDGPSIYHALSNGYNVIKSDKRHQTYLGGYLAASCIYSTVFDKDPTTLKYAPSDLKSADVNSLRSIAKKYCY